MTIFPIGQSLQELGKEKTSQKAVENNTQQFLKSLNIIETKLSEQINYLTQVSTGQPHEGSGYASAKVLQMAWHRIQVGGCNEIMLDFFTNFISKSSNRSFFTYKISFFSMQDLVFVNWMNQKVNTCKLPHVNRDNSKARLQAHQLRHRPLVRHMVSQHHRAYRLCRQAAHPKPHPLPLQRQLRHQLAQLLQQQPAHNLLYCIKTV